MKLEVIGYKIHHLDLFSGIGGFALGLQMADKDFYKTISFCEINAYCAEVLEKNFSGIPICRDIRELNTKGMQVDLITAGFPCQDLSIAGKGAGLKGERSGLFYETIKIAKESNAKFIIFENSPQLITNEQYQESFIKEIQEAGYGLCWRICSGREFGYPHQRKRLYALCFNASTYSDSFGFFLLEAFHHFYTNENTFNPSKEIISLYCEYMRRNKQGDFKLHCRDIRGDGLSQRLEQIHALGNSVIPQIVKIWGLALKQSYLKWESE